jgi:hypothetical protein
MSMITLYDMTQKVEKGVIVLVPFQVANKTEQDNIFKKRNIFHSSTQNSREELSSEA